MSAPKKGRTFKKYSYRGIDLDKLLELSTDQVRERERDTHTHIHREIETDR